MAEVALAVVLVVGAGLMIRSVRNLLSIDAGFKPDGVLTMQLSTPAQWYPDSMRVIAFWNDLQRRVASVPGVTQAGAVRNLPLATEMGDWGLAIEGYTPPPNQGTPGDWQIVTPGYFEAIGMKLEQGRFFDQRDDYAGPLAMIVNQTFVDSYLKGRNPLGARVRVNGSDSTAWYSIVGVVEDVHHNTLTVKPKPGFYATLAQYARAPGSTRRSMTLVVRTTVDPASLAAPIRAIVHDIDLRLPVSGVRTMRDVVNNAIAGQRFAMQALGVFGVLALVLSAIGIFGIVSQVVASRSQEFGIRAALGATPRELMTLSLSVGMRQIFIGLGIGIIASLMLTRAMTSMLQGVRPTDPITFAVVTVLIASVAALASLGPARRAGRADPARVLGGS
jgi:predicted permease